MEYNNIARKIAPFIIVIILVLAVFALRAETINIGGVSDPSQKELYRDDSGMPYFTEIDSYYNYRLTENYLNGGHLGDTYVNGEDWDSLSTSPDGRAADYEPLLIVFTANVYEFLNSFTSVSLTQVAFWLGSVVSSLAVIPAYFIVRRSTHSEWGAIVAGVIAGAAPAYFSHTYGGFFDTDMFNVLLPLLIVLFLTESIYTKRMSLKVVFSVVAAGLLGLSSLAWSGYFYMIALTYGALILYIPASYIMDRRDGVDMSNRLEWLRHNPATVPLIVFIVLSAILLFFLDPDLLETISDSLGIASSLQNATVGTAYPNVYVSVGEMQVPAIIDVANQSGGLFTLLFALIGLFVCVYVLRRKPKKEISEEEIEEIKSKPTKKKVRSKRYTPKTKKAEELKEETHEHRFIPGRYELTADEKHNDLFLYLTLFLWIIGLAFMLTQGTRFIEQFAVPVALLSGIFVGIMIKYIDLRTEQKAYVAAIAVIFVVLAVASPLYADYQAASQSVGSTNDDMYNTLTWINQNTPANSVLASWWDFGHLFTEVAHRQVVFDGGSQNNMRAYWIGNALQTHDQDLSAGILRMLANSGESASDTLDLYTNDTAKSVTILNEILPMDRSAASSTLTGTYGLQEQEANAVLDLTHPSETKPVYLILSSDMLSKASWWSYFGTWDFEAQNSTYYSYYSSESGVEQINGMDFTLGLDNGVVGVGTAGGSADAANGSISSGMTFEYLDQSKLNQSVNMSTTEDKERMATEVADGTGNELIKPHELIYVDNNQLSEQIVNNDSNMSIMVIHQSDDSYFTVLFDSYLENSTFTKLFLESGYNATRFNLSHSEPGVSVWDVSEYAGEVTNDQSVGPYNSTEETDNTT